MSRSLDTRYLKARKAYDCDACHWWLTNGDLDQLDEIKDEGKMLDVKAAEADKYRILPGQRYMRAILVDGRDFYTYRARPEMHDLIIELDLMPESDE